MNKVHPLDAVCVAVMLHRISDKKKRSREWQLEAIRFQGEEILATLSLDFESFIDWNRGKLGLKFHKFAGNSLILGHAPSALLKKILGGWISASPALYLDIGDLAEPFQPSGHSQTIMKLRKRFLGDRDDLGHDASLVHQIYLALVKMTETIDRGELSNLGEMAPEIRDLSSTQDYPESSMDQFPFVIESETPLNPIALEFNQLFSLEGPLAAGFPSYRPRNEQIEMAIAVASTLDSEHESARLIVEGGTGIGKSFAYLVPSILFSFRNKTRVVISTGTINLQEQLIQKDVPDMVAALTTVKGFNSQSFRYALLKGRGNYLCLRRWEMLDAEISLPPDQNSFRAKLSGWVKRTKTGDRSEIQLTEQEQLSWDNVSASNYNLCERGRDGTCFYRQARENITNAHLVIVNHSLLLSNVLVGETLIPEFEHLIIDEAHNLEAEATNQFGFHLAQNSLEETGEHLDELLNRSFQNMGKGRSVSRAKNHLHRQIKKIQFTLSIMGQNWRDLMTSVVGFVEEQKGVNLTSDESIRITAASRVQPSWSGLEVEWAEFDQSLESIESMVDSLLIDIERFSQPNDSDRNSLSLEFGDLMLKEAQIRDRIRSFFAYPEVSMVYWADIIFSSSDGTSSIRLNGAPLNVAEHLNHQLYSLKRSVVLTSATLAVRGDFAHAKHRLGLEDAEELHLNSPFDYEKAVLFCVPTDIPEPSDSDYVESISHAIFELVVMAGGHTMVLFTAHSMLQAVARRLGEFLESSAINLLIQSTNGTPHQLIERFQQSSNAVLLGTSSFWEGVDIGNGSLKVLVVARLPFNVPTDPIFMARSELYENPFREYALPQAVLRFRQGFGRLIRGSHDFGAVIVLDRRVASSNYGKWFTGSIPLTTTFNGSIEQILSEVEKWITRPA